MDFKEAVNAMKEGKKVRRINWDENKYFVLEENIIKVSSPFNLSLDVEQIEATDWEIYEDNWNAKDKISNYNELCDTLDEDDLKILKEKILEDIDNIPKFDGMTIGEYTREIKSKIGKRFGF